MPLKAPALVPPPVYNWTGFYVGGEVGGRWDDANWDTTCLIPGVPGAVCPGANGFRDAISL